MGFRKCDFRLQLSTFEWSRLNTGFYFGISVCIFNAQIAFTGNTNMKLKLKYSLTSLLAVTALCTSCSVFAEQNVNFASYDMTAEQNILPVQKINGNPYLRDSSNSGYRGYSGARYQYDLSDPMQRNEYMMDSDAQMRDSLNVDVGTHLDRSMGQYGGGYY